MHYLLGNLWISRTRSVTSQNDCVFRKFDLSAGSTSMISYTSRPKLIFGPVGIFLNDFIHLQIPTAWLS